MLLSSLNDMSFTLGAVSKLGCTVPKSWSAYLVGEACTVELEVAKLANWFVTRWINR